LQQSRTRLLDWRRHRLRQPRDESLIETRDQERVQLRRLARADAIERIVKVPAKLPADIFISTHADFRETQFEPLNVLVVPRSRVGIVFSLLFEAQARFGESQRSYGAAVEVAVSPS